MAVLDTAGMAREMGAFVQDSAGVIRLVRHLEEAAGRAEREIGPGAGAVIGREVAANLEDKRGLSLPDGSRFPLTERELSRTVIDYELFKAESFVGSGVFPKRYFGYFDGKWDTAPYERELISTTRGAVGLINAWQAEKGRAVRLTDAEVAVTFIAEGGAILLRENQSQLERIHPVQGIGLDDFREGFARYPGLVSLLDAKFGTGLASLGERDLSFREAVLGTAVMMLFEKERAARMMAAKGRDLLALDPDGQFIVAELVYNSGLLFDPERIEEIRSFRTGGYLSRINGSVKERPLLPLAGPTVSTATLLEKGYPEQPTSWSAVYHVLQRWGAYQALRRCTDLFGEDGMFR